MKPQTTVWISVLTLIVSIGTLWMVWQMQSQLAHTDADAAFQGGTQTVGGTSSLTLDDRETRCKEAGGTWTEHMDRDGSTTGGECKRGTLVEKYDKDGRPIIR